MGKGAPYSLNSFFSGIGGFELAFERNGFRTRFLCENDNYCRRVLQLHWPNVVAARDIRDLRAEEIPEANVWTAGFPCQDLSLAKVPHGRSGFRGHQSSLFFTFGELLAKHLPQVVLLENVAGLLNSHKGRDFASLLGLLTSAGYGVAWRVLNARYFGVPQSRPRVFICAWLNDPASAVASLFEAKRSEVIKGERAGFITPSFCPKSGAYVPLISYCISATSGRHTGLDWARSYVAYERDVRRPTPLECERLQGLPDNWTKVSDQDITPIDRYDTERYEAIGNAVAIPVVEWISRKIKARLTRVPRKASASLRTKGRAEVDLTTLAVEFRGEEMTAIELYHQRDTPWKRGGCAYRGHVVRSQVSTAPVQPVASRFVDILQEEVPHRRYFLSSNAAKGILRRVERRGRHLFHPLEQSLHRLASAERDSTARLRLPWQEVL
jgi:DNA (cytosine-5)-methyltransferase 1